MIDLLHLNKAVCGLFSQALEAAGTGAHLAAEDVRAPIIRPCGKVEFEDGTEARLLASGEERTATFRLYYFAADRDRPKLENLAVRRAIGAAFLDGITVDGLYLGIDEGVRFAVSDGVLMATIDLNWSEPLPETESEFMETLIYEHEEVNI